MLKDFITWMAEASVKGLFCGAVFIYGVPPVCDFLIKEIDQAMQRGHT